MYLKSLRPSHWKEGFLNRVIKYSRPFISNRKYLEILFKHRVGYALDLEHPRTFCEKIQWLKFNLIRKDFSRMVDKAEAKEYVKSIIGDKYIVPTYGIWDSVDNVDWDLLPNKFVLKKTNDSGGVLICKDKSTFDIDNEKNKLSTRNHDYSKYNCEYPYKEVKNRIIAEELLIPDNDEEIKDYKMYCFNGRAEFCQVIADRRTDETIDFYDREWKHQEFIGLIELNSNVHQAIKTIPKPDNYSEMCVIADKIALSINTPFVRVDLYNVNGKIYFGEITFFPASGMGKFNPVEWDYRLGDMIKLPINN